MSTPRFLPKAAVTAAALALMCAAWQPVGAATAAPSNDLAKQLRLSLPFDGTLKDASGKGHDASLFSTAAPQSAEKYVDGVAGKAVLLDGSTALSTGTDAELSPQDLTLSFWFKPSAAMGSGEQLFAWSKQAYNSEGWYLSSEGSGIPLALSVGASTGQPFKVSVRGSRDAFFPTDRFTHVVVSFDASTHQVKVTRDGRLQESTVDYGASAAAPGTIKPDGSTHNTLGFNGPVYKGAFLKGAVDDYRVYGAPASLDEAVDLYREHAPDFDTTTVAKEDLDAVKLAGTATGPFRVQALGAQGSQLTWSSSDPAIALEGETASVTRGEDDREVTLTASASYAGSAKVTRTFTVLVKAKADSASADRNAPAKLEQVTVNDEYLVNAQNLTVDYLLSLEPERFLNGFYTLAGLPTTAPAYGGWEATSGTRFSGHFAGHFVSALAQAYSTEQDAATKAKLLAKLTAMVDGLKKAQTAYALKDPANAGYVSPFPVGYLPAGKDGLLVPFYNLHKVLAGLLDASMYAPADVASSARVVADGFGTWLGGYVAKQADPAALLRTEYGGMNEALYELFELTHKPEHLRAAKAFDEVALFRQLANGKDVLDGLHANTTIPKLIGALKRYSVYTGDAELEGSLSEAERADLPMYRQAAENFWQMVVDDHSYANGGNSQSEHFHAPNTLFEWATTGVASGYGENSTSEGCNEYNMLKLSSALFELTGDVKYADFYEETFLNTIVASQNPESGMVTYFQPMTSGYAKVFGHEQGEFWCDHGSGIESFTKLGDGIYFSRGKDVSINRYTPSSYTSPALGLTLKQAGQVPAQDTVKISVAAAAGATPVAGARVKLRVPSWIEGQATLRINGAQSAIAPVGGYLTVPVSAGDELELVLKPATRVVSDAQNPDWVAFKYGPVLLATELNRDRVGESYVAGVLVRMSTGDTSVDSTVTVADAGAFRENIGESLVRVDDAAGATGNAALRFELAGQDGAAKRVFEPYFSLYEARYAVYMTLVEPDSEAAQAAILKRKVQEREKATTTDLLTSFDNNNSEAGKNYQFNRSGVGVYGGRPFRDAQNTADAWFSYEMAVDQSAKHNYLCVSYYGGDAGRTFDVLIDGVLLKSERISGDAGATKWYEQCDEIPAEQVAKAKSKQGAHGGAILDQDGKEIPVVTVRFQGNGKSFVGGIYGVYTRTSTSYDTASELSSLAAKDAQISPALTAGVHSYELTVGQASSSVELSLAPASPSGLIYVDGVLIDDTLPRAVQLASMKAARAATGNSVVIRSVAQDHSTATEYVLNVARAEAPGDASADEQAGADSDTGTGSDTGTDADAGTAADSGTSSDANADVGAAGAAAQGSADDSAGAADGSGTADVEGAAADADASAGANGGVGASGNDGANDGAGAGADDAGAGGAEASSDADGSSADAEGTNASAATNGATASAGSNGSAGSLGSGDAENAGGSAGAEDPVVDAAPQQQAPQEDIAKTGAQVAGVLAAAAVALLLGCLAVRRSRRA